MGKTAGGVFLGKRRGNFVLKYYFFGKTEERKSLGKTCGKEKFGKIFI